MKLSKRLKTIESLITSKYDQIWDCCCDHGQLGINLLNRNAAEQVHFVDIVPALTDKLERTLSAYSKKRNDAKPSLEKSWFVHCRDVAQLPLPREDEQNNILIIIAGVGGDLVADFVAQIIKDHPHHQLDFIVCPVLHNVKVRETLASLNLGLINECIVKENQRFYEVIHVSTRSPIKIKNIGSIMWNLSLIEHQQYLSKIIAHYQRMAHIPSKENQLIIDAYSHLTSAS